MLLAFSALAVIAVLVVPVFAAPIDTLTPHAVVEGLAIVKTEMGGLTFDSDAVLTFWSYTPSGEVAEHEEPGYAVTLQVDDTLYVWHVAETMACGSGSFLALSADPHPLPGVDEAEEGPCSILAVLYHDIEKPLAVVAGRNVFFIGNTLVT